MLSESVGGSDYKVVMGWGQQWMEAYVKVYIVPSLWYTTSGQV